MKEHPIPQDITGYRFHIVGSMTLKQFGEMLLGTILAGLVFTTNLIDIIKFPIMFVLFAGGVIAAFLPIGERPLSHWLVTFFRILYKPTQFFWKRSENIPELFLFKAKADVRINIKDLDLTPARRQRIKEFLSSSHEKDSDETEFSPEEQQQMLSVLSLFSTQPLTIAATIVHQTTTSKPALKIRVRGMRATPPKPIGLDHTLVDNPNLSPPNKDVAKIEPFQLSPDMPRAETVGNEGKKSYLETQAVAGNVIIPKSKAIKLETSTKEELEEAVKQDHKEKPDEQVYLKTKIKQETQEVAAEGQFNAELPFPSKPTEPNRLVGMVLTPNNELIPGAIVEIRAKDGQIARAVKTNALGQFFVTTPLKKGEYIVDVEKSNYSFSPLSIELKNKIIDPLEVRSQ